jgi:ATP-binding cassette subfamily B protein
MSKADIEKSAAAARRLVSSGLWALRFAWPRHRRFILGLSAISLANGLFPAGLALVMRGLINTVVAATTGGDPVGFGFTFWLLAGLVLTLTEVGSRLSNRYLAQRFEDELELDITARVMEHADALDLAFFEDTRFQDIMERAQQNTTLNFVALLTNVLSVVTHVVQIVSLTAILLALEPIAILLLLPIALAHFTVQWRISRRHYQDERGRTAKRRWVRYFVSLLTSREHVPEVKLLDLGPLIVGRFREYVTEFRDRNRVHFRRSYLWGSFFALLTTLAVYVVFARLIAHVVAGALSVGDIAVFGVAALRLRNALDTVVASSTRGMAHALFISHLSDLFEIDPAIPRSRGLKTGLTSGRIVFEEVTFQYPGSGRPALEHLSLSIEPGETVALVGRNGAGKSTLVRLICRFYDTYTGRISIDGIDIRELAPEYLQQRIGCVFQQPVHFEATAAENIAYGDWRNLLEAGARVEEIARRAGVSGIIEALPQGYETRLGRRFGEQDLSLGQWQQLAIARALARDARILVLDEPASSLDAQVEYELFSKSRELASGRTTILISHRFSTVSMADRILVIDAGHIVEDGTHADLLAAGGHYARLYRFQQKQLTKSEVRSA